MMDIDFYFFVSSFVHTMTKLIIPEREGRSKEQPIHREVTGKRGEEVGQTRGESYGDLVTSGMQ